MADAFLLIAGADMGEEEQRAAMLLAMAVSMFPWKEPKAIGGVANMFIPGGA
jgi:hypothetical protein